LLFSAVGKGTQGAAMASTDLYVNVAIIFSNSCTIMVLVMIGTEFCSSL